MTTPKLVAYSHSRLEAFETCPRKYWEISVAKNIQEPPSDAQTFGDEVHKAFKMFFKAGQPLPLHLRQYTPYLERIAAAPGDKIVEQQIALNAQYQQVDWFAKDAYVRVISDLTQHHRTEAITWDWKTGKPHDKFDQLKLTSAVTFILAPEIERITMAYFWTKNKSVTSKVMTKADQPAFWSEHLPRVQAFQNAYAANAFPPKPNYLCEKYCPVKTCQYNGKRHR